jgi:hypothetical protein
MKISFIKKAAGYSAAILCLASVAAAQPPGGGGAPGGGGGRGTPAQLQIPTPTYITIPLEITINRPAEEVWKRVGKFCDIGEWLQVPCMILSGKDGEVGALRSIGREVLVGKTDLSYTYTQPVYEGRQYNLYHGTMEAKPLTATTTKMVYTLVYDNSMLADDAARDRDKQQKTQQFTRAIENMKTLCEGGTLPAPAARGGGRGGAGGGGGRGPQ